MLVIWCSKIIYNYYVVNKIINGVMDFNEKPIRNINAVTESNEK